MRRVGSDEEEGGWWGSSELFASLHFVPNAAAAMVHLSLFAVLAVGAMQEWRCKCCQWQARRGEEGGELLASWRSTLHAAVVPGMWKCAHGAEEEGDSRPNLARYHSMVSSCQRRWVFMRPGLFLIRCSATIQKVLLCDIVSSSTLIISQLSWSYQ